MTMEDIDDIEEEKICREKVTDNDEDDIDENDENDQGSNPNAAKTPVALLQVHVAWKNMQNQQPFHLFAIMMK